MATKTGPLGIRYSGLSILFAVVAVAITYEMVSPAWWQLVSALPKTVLVAGVLIGVAAIISAFLSDNVTRFRGTLIAIATICLLGDIGLLSYGVYFYYPTTRTWKVPAKAPTATVLLDEPTPLPYKVRNLTTDWGAHVQIIEKQSHRFTVRFDIPAPAGDGGELDFQISSEEGAQLHIAATQTPTPVPTGIP